MANILNRQHYHKGDRIFRTGDGATSAFFIQAGSVDIIVGQGDAETVVSTLGPGEIFGEMALRRRRAALGRRHGPGIHHLRPDHAHQLPETDRQIRRVYSGSSPVADQTVARNNQRRPD